MSIKTFIVPIVVFWFISASTLWGSDCNSCHTTKGVKERVPTVEPITIKADGKIRKISLADAFRFHGHSCPGMTTTFRALQYGFLLLFGEEIPEQSDLAIISRTPVSGSLDMLDLAMIGENRAEKTYPPQGMKAGRDAFWYTLYRKSTSMAVDIHLKPELYPKDFFEYKKKQADKKLTPEEWQIFHGCMREMILKFPAMSFEDLFGRPQPYKTIMWGAMMPAHNRPPVSGGDD
jgi:hypothetical protein